MIPTNIIKLLTYSNAFMNYTEKNIYVLILRIKINGSGWVIKPDLFKARSLFLCPARPV